MNVAIILNYNDNETTIRCLMYMRNYTSIDKIIVVDNCSTDNSYEKLSNFSSRKIDVIETKENRGYANGNNYGIKYAEKKYNPTNIIISNPDILVDDSSIKNICNYLDINSKVAAASAIVCDSEKRIVDNFAWRLPMYENIIAGTFLGLNKALEKIKGRSILYSKEALNKNYLKVDVLSGCFFVIKDRVLKEVGYFDENTFLFCEENILAFKLKKKSYESHILTSESLIHEHSVSINKSIKSWRKKQNIRRDSYIIYLRDYLNVSELKINIYKIFFEIGKYEKYLYHLLKK
ncbi:glycosyltransferase [Paenibacillus sp. 2TAB26]|uniref:glycosyltransferase n=1 Tax=Paenibacillus sp. 2TAB26 TaxID=3233005 RepID=UPI003F9E5505